MLFRSSIEGPRCDLVYRGRKALVNGMCVVDLNKESTHRLESAMDDGTFEALCANPVWYIQNNQTFDRVKGNLSGALLTIECENPESDVAVEWMVIAERKDESIKQCGHTDSNGYLITQRSTF